VLTVRHVNKTYHNGGFFSNNRQPVLFDVSFEMKSGECLGIIGESGSGKSTLGRLIVGIEKPDRGEILFQGQNVWSREARLGHISAVFQDYSSSINPYFTVLDAISEMLKIMGQCDKKELTHMVVNLLKQVGLNAEYCNKLPHELSGGEAQRVCIARAISTGPQFLVLDEAISSLDASVQTQILNLLKELKERYQMSYLFITHDIQAVTYLCDRVLFFHNGQVIEQSSVSKLSQIKNEYSKKLISSVIPFENIKK
jgi:nickel transport system ATP-binding protein